MLGKRMTKLAVLSSVLLLLLFVCFLICIDQFVYYWIDNICSLVHMEIVSFNNTFFSDCFKLYREQFFI